MNPNFNLPPGICWKDLEPDNYEEEELENQKRETAREIAKADAVIKTYETSDSGL